MERGDRESARPRRGAAWAERLSRLRQQVDKMREDFEPEEERAGEEDGGRGPGSDRDRQAPAEDARRPGEQPLRWSARTSRRGWRTRRRPSRGASPRSEADAHVTRTSGRRSDARSRTSRTGRALFGAGPGRRPHVREGGGDRAGPGGGRPPQEPSVDAKLVVVDRLPGGDGPPPGARGRAADPERTVHGDDARRGPAGSGSEGGRLTEGQGRALSRMAAEQEAIRVGSRRRCRSSERAAAR